MGCLTYLKNVCDQMNIAEHSCIVLMLKNELKCIWFTCYMKSAYIQKKNQLLIPKCFYSAEISSPFFSHLNRTFFKLCLETASFFSHLPYTITDSLIQTVHSRLSKKQIFICLFSVYVLKVARRRYDL